MGSEMKVLTFSKKQLLQSLLTGVPQIIQAKGCFRKFMKTLVLVGCLLGCAYQVWSFMKVFWTYPTNVNNIVSHPNIIEVPAFTICEFNGVRPKKFCKKYPDLCTPNKSYEEFCREYFGFCVPDNTDELSPNLMIPAIPPSELPSDKNMRHTYKLMGNEKYDFIPDIRYAEKPVNLDDILEISVISSEGLPTNCFAYNVVWGNASATERTASIRHEILLMTQMSGELFYATTPRAIQMVVHSPFMKLNPFTEGFSLKPCTSYKLYLEKIQNYLLPAPYHTNCTDYLSLWKSRGGHGPLTKRMCVEECIFNKSIEMYGCFNPQQVNYPDDSAAFCFNMSVDDNSIENCNRICQLACYDERIQVHIEEIETSITSNQSNKSKCLTRITISFVRTQVQKFIYNKKYEGIEAFGYIGGFLGMWLGLSLIAVCDFLETCFVILLFVVRRLKNRNKKIYIKNMVPNQVIFI